MTNKLEKQFFQCFGIEPREFKSCDVGTFCPYEGQLCDDTCPYYRTYKVDYPTISDRILLELICILNTVTVPDLGDINTGRLKNTILEECINALTKVDWENRTPTKEEFINEIKTLFEEG